MLSVTMENSVSGAAAFAKDSLNIAFIEENVKPPQ